MDKSTVMPTTMWILRLFIQCVFVSVPQTTDKASIQRLTESFVTKLQADFPSTVSTIYRYNYDMYACLYSAKCTECTWF